MEKVFWLVLIGLLLYFMAKKLHIKSDKQLRGKFGSSQFEGGRGPDAMFKCSMGEIESIGAGIGQRGELVDETLMWLHFSSHENHREHQSGSVSVRLGNETRSDPLMLVRDET